MKVLAFSNHVNLGGTVSDKVHYSHDNFGTLWADFLLSTFPEEATSRDKGFAIRCKTYGPCAEALREESRKEVCVEGELKAADFSYGKYSWRESWLLLTEIGFGVYPEYMKYGINRFEGMGKSCAYSVAGSGVPGYTAFALLGQDSHGDDQRLYCWTDRVLAEEEREILHEDMSISVSGRLRPGYEIDWKRDSDETIMRKCNNFLMVADEIRPMLMKDLQGAFKGVIPGDER